MRRLVIIGGPTASGKSAVAVKLAKSQNGEIISADSAAVYRGMDIGSAKPDISDMDGIRHHLIDVCEPDYDFNVAEFCSRAKEAIEDISDRGKLPIIAGGTGFYIRALLYDTDFTTDKGADSLRASLMEKAEKDGAMSLYERLKEIDPDYAASVHPNNIKRVVRAIEFYEQTHIRFSEYNSRQHDNLPAYDFKYFILTMPREILYERIEKRVDIMVKKGLVDEVRRLKEAGVDKKCTSMQAIGYRQIYRYLDGECNLSDAIYEIKRDTRHFAKRQLTWWRREKDVIMLDVSEYDFDAERISTMIEGML